MTTIIAAFDFDKTITTRDTVLPFLFKVNSHSKKALAILRSLPVALRYQLGAIGNHQAKEKILSAFLAQYPYIDLLRKAMTFAQDNLPHWLRPQALRRIAWHQQQGHRCILVSAGLEIYLKPWSSALSFETTLATRLEVIADHVTGKILGQNCFGAEKMQRLLAYAGPRESFTLYAYGDSRGDQELLASADYPFYRYFPE